MKEWNFEDVNSVFLFFIEMCIGVIIKIVYDFGVVDNEIYFLLLCVRFGYILF